MERRPRQEGAVSWLRESPRQLATSTARERKNKTPAAAYAVAGVCDFKKRGSKNEFVLTFVRRAKARERKGSGKGSGKGDILLFGLTPRPQRDRKGDIQLFQPAMHNASSPGWGTDDEPRSDADTDPDKPTGKMGEISQEALDRLHRKYPDCPRVHKALLRAAAMDIYGPDFMTDIDVNKAYGRSPAPPPAPDRVAAHPDPNR